VEYPFSNILKTAKAPGLRVRETFPRLTWRTLRWCIADGGLRVAVVERSIRSLALNRKNALFAGSDGGGDHRAILASLVETSKRNGVDPEADLADVFTPPVADQPANRLGEHLPWNWAKVRQPQRAA
jgi:transposase